MKTSPFRPRRSEIEIGDLIRAAIELSPANEHQMQQVARCLGFGIKPLDESHLSHYRNPQIAGVSQRPFVPRPRDLKIPEFKPKPGMPKAPPVVPEAQGKILELIPDPTETTAVTSADIPPWPEKSLASNKRTSTPLLPRTSLFSTNKARGILLPVVSRVLPSPKPDITRIVQQIIKQEALRKISRLNQENTRNGCQLLLDFNDRLAPLWPDMRDLKNQFHRLLDDDSCPVYTFKKDPWAAFQRKDREIKPWTVLAEKPVVVASDLGQLGGDTSDRKLAEASWLRFADFCDREVTPLIAIVPINPFEERLRLLSRRIKIVPWSPLTTATAVKRLMTENR